MRGSLRVEAFLLIIQARNADPWSTARRAWVPASHDLQDRDPGVA